MCSWYASFRASICSTSALTNQSVLVLEDRKLTEIVTDYGLEVPYTTSRLKQLCLSTNSTEDENSSEKEDISVNSEIEADIDSEDTSAVDTETGDMLTRSLHISAAHIPQKDHEDSLYNLNWPNILQQVRCELTRPIRLIKSLVNVVSFQREDNIKHEVHLCIPTHLIEDLSIEHYQRLEDAFSFHDEGGKGYLSKSELRDCLRTLGHNFTEQQVWKLLAQVDVDHSGTLDFDEFFDLMSSMMCGWDPMGDLGICWRALDPKGVGRVKLKPLLKLFRKHGAKIGESEIEEMFNALIHQTFIDFDQFFTAVIDGEPEDWQNPVSE